MIQIALLSMMLPLWASEPAVQTGSQQLLASPYLTQVQGKRIGVLAHPASLLPDGTHLVDLLFKSKDVKLTLIFSPEHGFRGNEDVQLPDSRDSVTGLPVYSLYGPRKAPTPEMLSQVDVVLIDLQDVGVRFYTYASTMAYTLQACKQSGKKVIILDRPNPIGGAVVEGAVLESFYQGNLASLYPIITRHGLTMGELARFYNREFGIDADLSVIPLKGWNREMLWDQTGLPWVPSSPALTSFEQVFLYGIFGGMEALNFAVGRGQTNEEAFKIYGAPWITGIESQILTKHLNALSLPGLSFVPVSWTPTRREYEGQLCYGFRILLTDRARVEGFRSQIEVLRTLRRVLGARLNLEGTGRFLGARWIRDAILADQPTEGILARAQREAQEFVAQRARTLLYP